MTELSPMRGEVGINYDAAFLYLTVRGAVAERWGHGSGFGRHSIGLDNLSLTNKEGSRVAQVNLKNSLFLDSAATMDWAKFVTEASDFLDDCFTTLQPSAVSAIYADVKLYAEATTFSTARDRIASALLSGRESHAPTAQAMFDDLLVSLQYKQGLTTITTAVAPLRRAELPQHLQGDQDLTTYPDNMFFVQRRVELLAGPDREKDRIGWENAKERFSAFMSEHVLSVPSSVSQYVDELMGSRQA
jgi:hypothetical protein